MPQVLVAVLVDAYRQPLPELREEAYKGLVWLARSSSDTAALVAEQARGLFHHRGGDDSLLGLSLLEGLAEVLPGSIESFRSELLNLSRSPDAAERISALGLLNALGIPPLDIPAGRRRLPLTYRMNLPEFASEKYQPIATVLKPGDALPDTTDPLELVGAARDGLQLLSHETGIPLRNLVERTVPLMRTLEPAEQWNAAAERDLSQRLQAMGIETAYRRPRAGIAMRALSHVVAELIDAEVLEKNMLSRLRPALAPRDATLARIDPEPGMLSPIAITLPDDWSASSWYNEPISEERIPPSRDTDWTVLGFMTEADKPIWEMLREVRLGGLCSPNVDEGFLENQPERIIPWSLWWRADDYPDLHELEGPLALSLVLRSLPQRAEIGRAEWLALNPLVAASRGWQLSKDGLFRWVDANGCIMVESVWWRDGRLGRHPPRQNVCAEGWLAWKIHEELAGADEAVDIG
jgi:hypothetical protein